MAAIGESRRSAAETNLATIQVIYRNIVGVEKSLAGYLRVWPRVTENRNGRRRGFLLILNAF